MTKPSRVGITVWRALVAVTGLMALVTAAMAQQTPAPTATTGRANPDSTRVNPQAAALLEFQKRLNDYLALRRAMANTLNPLSSTPNASELTAKQDSLAAAIKTARSRAKRGDLIPPGAAQAIAKIVQDDVQRRNPTAQMGVFDEVPAKSGASLVNKTYPASEPLPTVPPLLLMNLPKLPDNLQYRFAGRDVVILDGDVQVVIDYIQNVLPPH